MKSKLKRYRRRSHQLTNGVFYRISHCPVARLTAKGADTVSPLEKRIRELRHRLPEAMIADRFSVKRELSKLTATARGSVSEESERRLKSLEHRIRRSRRKRREKEENRPVVTYPPSLPITEKADDIIDAIMTHPVIIVTGETGSGKTTQLPKMCLQAGRGIDGIIGMTEPRRIAATSVSRRIAEELGEPLGHSVGYKIRFDEQRGRYPAIKVMTDGILLMEMQNDPLLLAYDTIIIDEAHERSITIDFILGAVKRLLRKRHDLRVIIASATIEPTTFSRFFNNAPIVSVSGRLFPVDIRYRPIPDNDDTNYVEAAARAVMDTEKKGESGDVLVFMPTEQDIRETCDILTARIKKKAVVLPLFGRLTSSQQQRVFAPVTGRKIIVATNIAETSLTIPGIRYVIDTGLARMAEYSASIRTTRLPVKPIAKSSADQRKGRAGRVQNGITIRLYGEDDYRTRPDYTAPEILRSNLAEVILRMKNLGIGDVSTFPFINPPSKKNINDGFALLKELGAIEKKNRAFSLTERGKRMARMPVDPRIARMIIEAERFGCLNETLIIAAVLSIQDPRERPMDREKEADAVHRQFMNPASDFITFLTIWEKYHLLLAESRSNSRMRKYCRDHFLSYRRMREWLDIHRQLTEITVAEKGKKKPRKDALCGEALYAALHKAIAAGFLSQIAVKKEKNIYRAAKGKEVMLFPGSGLFNHGGDWIIAAETVETSRIFARTAAVIDSTWLEEIGGDLCRRAYLEPHWNRDRGEVVAYEKVTLFSLPIVLRRPVSFGRINPGEASQIFMLSALSEGDISEPLPFLDHNQALVRHIQTMEDKIRKRNILVEPETIADIYAERLPLVFDVRTLKKIIKDRGGDDFLRMTEDDVTRRQIGTELDSFPDKITIGTQCLPCTYRFEPDSDADGVTVSVSAYTLSPSALEAAELAIPGLLREKLTLLLRGLPKEYRRKLIPIPRTVDIMLNEMERTGGSLLANCADFVYRRFGVAVPADKWPVDTVPDHLNVRFAVVDSTGKELRAERSVSVLDVADSPDREDNPALRRARRTWEKSGIIRWDFGDLPPHITVESDTHRGDVLAFPALTVEDDTVAIRLHHTNAAADRHHAAGVLLLYKYHLSHHLRDCAKGLHLSEAARRYATYFGGAAYVESEMLTATLTSLADCTVRSEDAFLSAVATIKPRLYQRGEELRRVTEKALEGFGDARTFFHSLKKGGTTTVQFITKMENELNELMPRDFIERYDDTVLREVPRYTKALMIRARRGLDHLEKDRQKEQKYRHFADQLSDISTADQPPPSGSKKAALAAFRWMLEEYRIALFAPEIKTRYPISEKRLDKKLDDIERMI